MQICWESSLSYCIPWSVYKDLGTPQLCEEFLHHNLSNFLIGDGKKFNNLCKGICNLECKVCDHWIGETGPQCQHKLSPLGCQPYDFIVFPDSSIYQAYTWNKYYNFLGTVQFLSSFQATGIFSSDSQGFYFVSGDRLSTRHGIHGDLPNALMGMQVSISSGAIW